MRRAVLPLLVSLAASGTIAACATPDDNGAAAPASAAQQGNSVSTAVFGKTPAGETVDLYTLKNANGLEVRAITFGGIITALRLPDRNGVFADVALGFSELGPYLRNPPFFGAIIGRYGNRIARGRFTLDGRTYTLAVNDPPNHLHGGVTGFDKVVWKAESFRNADAVGIVFTHTSKDGDEGYPGTLTARVTYTLNDANELAFDYEATTDEATPVNLTQHTYFNLRGDGNGDILEHRLTIYASRMTPVDRTLIPTGIAPVDGTPFDFRMATAIGARIDADDPQIRAGLGYDHNFVLDRDGSGLTRAARVEEPDSGRVVEIATTEPGMQFYSGNHLNGSLTGKTGQPYARRSGFALETQHYPDSPNRPEFPSTILQPGQMYRSKTVLSFSVARD